MELELTQILIPFPDYLKNADPAPGDNLKASEEKSKDQCNRAVNVLSSNH